MAELATDISGHAVMPMSPVNNFDNLRFFRQSRTNGFAMIQELLLEPVAIFATCFSGSMHSHR